MSEVMVSKLPDADMQAVPRALLRAAQRARDVARQTDTPLVLMRDGVLVEELTGAAPQHLDTQQALVDRPA